jgi:lambda family phage tail tape measure protein
MTDFRINVIIDPGPAVSGAKKVETTLEATEGAAEKLYKQLLQTFTRIPTGNATADVAKFEAEITQLRTELARTTGQLDTVAAAEARLANEAREAAAAQDKIQKELGETQKRADGLEKELEQLKREFDESKNKGSSFGQTMRTLLLGVSFVVVINELRQLSDTFINVQNRLKTVTNGEEELGATTEELFKIAERTRSSFQGTAELYTRVGLSAKELGRTQGELLQFTESLNKAILLSGASAQEAESGLIQLSQGIASGALRGDELRSVLEQLPAVADVIAKSLGVTRGELRALGQEGKITADVVLDAFKQARVELDEKFGKSVPTLGQSFTVLNNSLIKFVGTVNESLGVSSFLSQTILLIANNVDILAAAVLVLAVSALPAAIVATKALIVQSTILKGVMAGGIFNPIVLGAAAAGAAIVLLVDKFVELQAEANKATEAGEKFALTEFGKVGADIQKVLANIKVLKDNINRDTLKGIEPNPTAVRLLAEAEQKLADLTQQQDFLRDGTARTTKEAEAQLKAVKELESAVAKLSASLDEEARILGLNSREREIQKALLEEIAKLEKDSTAKVTDEQRASIEATLRRNQALQEQADALDAIRGPQAEFEARLEALNVLLTENKITTDEFDKAVADLAASAKGVDLTGISLPTGGDVEGQLAKIKELVAAQQAQAKADAERAAILRDLAGPEADLLARKAILVSLLGNESVNQQRLAEALDEVNAKLNPLTEDEKRLKDLLEQIQGPERERQQRLQDLAALLAAGAINQSQYNDELERMGALVKTEVPLVERIQQLNAQFESGELTQAQYINELQKLEQFQGPSAEFLAGLDALNQKLADGTITAQQFLAEFAKLGNTAENPVVTFSDGIDDALTKLSEKSMTTGEIVSDTLVSAFDKASSALAEFATTGKLDFADFARSILADLAKILAQQLLLQALTGAGVPIPGLGGGATGAASGGDFDAHDPMIVGEKGPEMVRFGAPGNITPADQTARALAATGSGGGGGTTVNVAPPQVRLQVVNVDSPEAARNAMDSAEGGKIIVNQIRANREAIKRELG